MAHHEFPPLTEEAEKVLSAGIEARARVSTDNPGGIFAKRIFAAAVVREAMEQASPDRQGSCKWDRLGAIADNLHALPPPPPTREQMEIALGRLLRHTNDPAGCHEGNLIAELANVLRRGIAHHCKVQP